MTGVHDPLEGMEFRHYSRHGDPFILDRSHVYDEEHTGSGKPMGLWLSVLGENDWYEWSTLEGYGTESLEHAYRVVLRPEARIYVVTALDGLLALDRLLPPRFDYGESLFRDWSGIREHWDGVVIAPYQWRVRLNFNLMWYYGWDCASGCIWNLDAIESVEPVDDGPREVPSED